MNGMPFSVGGIVGSRRSVMLRRISLRAAALSRSSPVAWSWASSSILHSARSSDSGTLRIACIKVRRRNPPYLAESSVMLRSSRCRPVTQPFSSPSTSVLSGGAAFSANFWMASRGRGPRDVQHAKTHRTAFKTHGGCSGKRVVTLRPRCAGSPAKSARQAPAMRRPGPGPAAGLPPRAVAVMAEAARGATYMTDTIQTWYEPPWARSIPGAPPPSA